LDVGFFFLQSTKKYDTMMTSQDALALKERILNGYQITKDEALELVRIEDKEVLYQMADDIRRHFLKNDFEMCSIINARSGKCSEDCKWCSQSAHHNTNVEVYPLIASPVAVAMARDNAKQGVAKFSLVTSGRTLSQTDVDKSCGIYNDIRREVDIHLCASMGLLNKAQLQQLADAGVEHYHCNLETAPSFFPTLCTTHTTEEKLQTIQWAKEAGLGICSGGIIGMGESEEQRVEFALALREIGAESIPINILNPIEGTKLAGKTQKLTEEEILTTFAIFRVVNPTAKIRFAAGRQEIAHVMDKALRCGMSAALVGDLLTTLGSSVAEDVEMLEKNGYKIVRS